MSTIITREIQGSGPYAYRVEYHADEQDHQWEYLGPVGAVDPEQLTDEETAELRAEGFALARYRDTPSHDLRKREIANEIRDRLDAGALAPTDDRRSSVVELAEDAPAPARQLVEGTAADMRQELDAGAGQEPLTEHERSRIDFGETTIPEARTAKATILEEGVEDWTTVWSEDLNPNNEAREAARREQQAGTVVGDRLDNDEGPDDRTTSIQETRSEAEQQALRYAREGDEDAREYLLEAGWTESEIEQTAAPAA
ncbi:hypothetical protein DJ83_11190 [Halorubrum ezzemoulense]|uniref:Uncharacterized protein n=1 Tax=Halorubrum ezzemoulense TaxID=337243 RepID=A0A256ITH0_HALEZ|nr:hypothetical protein [Halorubrum ezzemoulense]OYR59850.1 hypothetical protein DJ83_11190 [Halorubrum ezzemoulense]